MSARGGNVAALALGLMVLVQCSGDSGSGTHFCPGLPANPPADPTALVLSVVSGTQIDLTWTDNATDETGLRVERSGDGVNFLEIALLAANSVAHSDTTLSPGTAYWYRVRATNSGGDSGTSNIMTATTFALPPAPTGLVAIAVSPSQVSLSWTDNSANETGFRVERSSDGVNFIEISVTAADATTYPSTGLPAETTRWYRVRATNAGGNSGYTNIASATTWESSAWRTLGHNARHTGHNRSEAGGPPMPLAWSQPIVASALHPVVAENGLVFAANDGTSVPGSGVRAFIAATGALAWSDTMVGAQRIGQPATYGGRVHVVGVNSTPFLDTRITALDAASGALDWNYVFGFLPGTPWAPVVSGGRVYGHFCADGSVFGMDAADGTAAAFIGLETVDQASVAFGNGLLYTFMAGNLRAHDPATLAVLWQVNLPWTGMTMSVSPVIGDSLIYVAAPPDLYAIDPLTQAIAWSTTGFDTTVNAAFANGTLFVTAGGTVQARDAATGAWLWSIVTGVPAAYPPVIAGNTMYLAGTSSGVAINLGTLATMQVMGSGGWYSVAEGRLYAARPDGELRCFQLSAGTPAGPVVIPPAPTGLTATPSSSARITLTWTDAATDEMSYRVERTPDGVVYTLLTILGANATSWADVGLAASTIYGYRVRATNAIGDSAWTPTVFATTNATASAWPMHSGGPDHLGNNALETGHPPLSPAWQAALSGDPLNPVVVEDGLVFVTDAAAPAAAKTLRARQLSDGSPAWSAALGVVPSLGAPAVAQGRVFVQAENGAAARLLCHDARSGGALWAAPFAAAGQTYFAPTIAAGKVWINAGATGGCAGFDARDGQRLFFNGTLENYDRWTPGFRAGTLFTYVAGNFRAHVPTTGATLWTTALAWPAGTSMDTVPAIGATHAYAVGLNSINAINLATHAVDATQPTSPIAGSPVVSGSVVFAVWGGTLHAHDATTLAPLWSFGGDGTLNHTPLVAGGHVYVSSDANAYAVDLGTQAPSWTDAVGGHLSLAAGKLLIARPDGTLSAYSLTP